MWGIMGLHDQREGPLRALILAPYHTSLWRIARHRTSDSPSRAEKWLAALPVVYVWSLIGGAIAATYVDILGNGSLSLLSIGQAWLQSLSGNGTPQIVPLYADPLSIWSAFCSASMFVIYFRQSRLLTYFPIQGTATKRPDGTIIQYRRVLPYDHCEDRVCNPEKSRFALFRGYWAPDGNGLVGPSTGVRVAGHVVGLLLGFAIYFFFAHYFAVHHDRWWAAHWWFGIIWAVSAGGAIGLGIDCFLTMNRLINTVRAALAQQEVELPFIPSIRGVKNSWSTLQNISEHLQLGFIPPTAATIVVFRVIASYMSGQSLRLYATITATVFAVAIWSGVNRYRSFRNAVTDAATSRIGLEFDRLNSGKALDSKGSTGSRERQWDWVTEHGALPDPELSARIRVLGGYAVGLLSLVLAMLQLR
jgi:hypothetical protein